MKIRTDFVTNSSSSGFVCIKVIAEKGNFEIQDDYDSGWGGWIWNYRNIDDVIKDLGNVKNGEELYALLTESVESFEYFPDVEEMKRFLTSIEDRNDLKIIELGEDTSSDDGDDYNFFLKYDFKNDKVLEHVDGYGASSSGVYVSIAELQNLREDKLLELVQWHFDGDDKNVWKMTEFFEWLDEDEQKQEIDNFKSNNIHFDKNDRYVGWIKGSSNNLYKLVDFEELAESIAENGSGVDWL